MNLVKRLEIPGQCPQLRPISLCRLGEQRSAVAEESVEGYLVPEFLAHGFSQ